VQLMPSNRDSTFILFLGLCSVVSYPNIGNGFHKCKYFLHYFLDFRGSSFRIFWDPGWKLRSVFWDFLGLWADFPQ
jgi:hypothetical protein